jgi:hypothetical protein
LAYRLASNDAALVLCSRPGSLPVTMSAEEMISPATVSGRNGGRPKTEIEGMDAIQRYEESTRKEEEENMTEAEKQMRDEELSFYTNSENEFGDDNIWGLLSGVGGNIYEWYVTAICSRDGSSIRPPELNGGR